MHEAALAREDYMCALEKSNTDLQEHVRAANHFDYNSGKSPSITIPLFTYEAVTTTVTTKPTTKRATKKRTTKGTTKDTT